MLAGVLEVSVKCGSLPPDVGDLTGLELWRMPGVVVSVFRRSQISGLRPRLNDTSDTKRLPNTSIYN